MRPAARFVLGQRPAVLQAQLRALEFVGRQVRLSDDRPARARKSVDEFRTEFDGNSASTGSDVLRQNPASDAVASLQDCRAQPGLGEQAAGREARSACSDDQHIDLGGHCGMIFAHADRSPVLVSCRALEERWGRDP